MQKSSQGKVLVIKDLLTTEVEGYIFPQHMDIILRVTMFIN